MSVSDEPLHARGAKKRVRREGGEGRGDVGRDGRVRVCGVPIKQEGGGSRWGRARARARPSLEHCAVAAAAAGQEHLDLPQLLAGAAAGEAQRQSSSSVCRWGGGVHVVTLFGLLCLAAA